jgi:sigma-B regulation protein RsbU (phosphoserine phosphatase)
VEGVPLGLLDAREYEESVFQAEPGDVAVLFSDGITDHLNAAGTEFGRSRLAQIVRAGCGLSASALIARIFQELDQWSTTAFDDQTLFVMKVK